MSTHQDSDSQLRLLGKLATLSAIAVLFFTYFLWQTLRTYWKLRGIPGPFWAKITDLHRVWVVKTKKSHEIHQKYHEQHGDLVRLGPNMVSVSDPGAIPTVYPMRPGFPKGKFYNAFIPYTKGGSPPAIFTSRDENLHKQLKNPIASLYNLSSVVTFESFVDETLGILCRQLDERFVDSHQAFDLGKWLQYFAFEVMGTMTFSKRYGFLETGKDVNGMLATIWSFMLTVAPMTQVPWLDKLLHKNAFASGLKKQSGNSILKIAADSTLERKRQMEAGGAESQKRKDKDFLSRFLEIQSANPETPPWAATVWTFSNVIAGSDSTAVVMGTAMYNLLAHPQTLNRLYEELLEVEQKGGLSQPYPAWNEVSDLPYLDSCVNEAIRLHPPFCLPLERVVPEGGITVSGQVLEGGTVVGMNPYVVNRHRPTFGEDADSWRPERWLEGDQDHKRKLNASIMTFGAGRRVCLGKYVAIMELKKVVPALLLNYHLELLDPKSHSTENSYFFRHHGICVKAVKRNTPAVE